jgi:hypothetical protein
MHNPHRQKRAGADEFEHRLRTALLAPTHTTKEVPTFCSGPLRQGPLTPS